MSLIQLLIDRQDDGDDKEFEEAFLHLANRLIQHAESLKMLVELGLYGDAWTIMRSSLSGLDMIYYLHYNPELISLFLKEEKTSYQDDKEFKKKFSEGAISRNLIKNGMPSRDEAFQLMSKGAHASAYGGQLFCKVVGQNVHMKYSPGFEADKMAAFSSILCAYHWDIVTAMLWHRHNKGLPLTSPKWKSIIRRQENMARKVQALSNASLALYEMFSEANKSR